MQKEVCLCDLVNQKIEFDGIAQVESLSENSFLVRMENDEVETVWKILKKGIIIENYGEARVILTLNKKGNGIARVFSPYGELHLPLANIQIESAQTPQGLLIQVHYILGEEGTSEPFAFSLLIQDFCPKQMA